MINYSFNDRMNGFQHPNVLLKKDIALTHQ